MSRHIAEEPERAKRSRQARINTGIDVILSHSCNEEVLWFESRTLRQEMCPNVGSGDSPEWESGLP
jgi:hypothetical protein